MGPTFHHGLDMTYSRILYGGVIFLSALLLFLIEPIAAKQLLPMLGGSSAVWMTCLVFFQFMLLLGYLYAHWMTNRFSRAQEKQIHFAFLAVATVLLAVRPLIHTDLQSASAHPVTAIFFALTITIGLPFILLASTSPLLQVWLSRKEQGSIKFGLFALSNAGSMLALILYPTLVEPHLALHFQQLAWTVGFVLFAILSIVVAHRAYSAPQATPPLQETTVDDTRLASTRQRWLWFLLPMAAAMQLSAVTEHLTQNIAAIPLLWVLPLAVYLLTFILAFNAPSLYRRWLVIRLLVVMLASLRYMLMKTDMSLPIGINISLFLVAAFIICYFCHAETFALRPQRTSEATQFYLLIAAGGVAGTFLIGIANPFIFTANYDLSLSFGMTAALALFVTWHDGWAQRLLWSTGTVLMFVLIFMQHKALTQSSLILMRNFCGPLRVEEGHAPPQALTVRTLLNGGVKHGTQWFGTEFHRTPTTYYAEDSGIGIAMKYCCAGRSRNIGVIGLGAGTLAAYSQAGDRFRFYEINPLVKPIAQHLFTYLRDSPAQLSFVEGDARISLTRESSQNFDVLAIDAFSGDAIPLHLLTREAVALYQRHLVPNGILAFHVSNQYLDLAPEIVQVAASQKMQAKIIDSSSNDARGEYAATWVLVSKDATFLARPEISTAARLVQNNSGLRVWTDDYSSLLPILRWMGR